MGASLLITLREGLEISLVLAILLGYLVKTGRGADTRAVWLGAGVAALGCAAAGVAVHAVTDELTGKAEQAVEGTMALLACGVLTWMILWMHRNARSMGGHLRARSMPPRRRAPSPPSRSSPLPARVSRPLCSCSAPRRVAPRVSRSSSVG